TNNKKTTKNKKKFRKKTETHSLVLYLPTIETIGYASSTKHYYRQPSPMRNAEHQHQQIPKQRKKDPKKKKKKKKKKNKKKKKKKKKKEKKKRYKEKEVEKPTIGINARW